jgi:signal transduction histidine kinase
MFAICLGLAIPAMALLTVKALELDLAQVKAQRQAELDEAISNALWTMDTRLTPILAQEAARPEFEYSSFLPTTALLASDRQPRSVRRGAADDARPDGARPDGATTVEGGPADSPATSTRSALSESETVTPSRLLVQPSPYVQLSFQCSANGCVTSPQCPDEPELPWAIRSGADPEQIDDCRRRLADFIRWVDYDQLLEMLPEQSLPQWQDFVPESNVANTPWQANHGQVVSQNVDLSRVSSPNQHESTDPAVPLPPAVENIIQLRESRSQSPARQSSDFNNRNSALQAFAQREIAGQRNANPAASYAATVRAATVREGVSRPLWIGSQLLLARRVTVGEQTVIQGCWLNWQEIEALLRREVRDILPEFTFEPVRSEKEVKIGRLLATLPVQIHVPPVTAEPLTLSPMRIALLIAWLCLALVTLTGGMLLAGVITLSERRAAFVSAVTHELRTPLTTFRMYAEMLAENMVPEASRVGYLRTLQSESDRLSHLVENVLQYARLERNAGEHKQELITLATLAGRIAECSRSRLDQTGMQLVIELRDQDRDIALRTDPRAIEQIAFNLIDNACKYAGAADDRRIHLVLAVLPREVTLTIRDHGPGIPTTARRRLFQPFSKSAHEAARSAPGVGLGLALSRRLSTSLGGRLELVAADTDGACFKIRLPRPSERDLA